MQICTRPCTRHANLYSGTSFVRAVRVVVAVGDSVACGALTTAAYVLQIVVFGEFFDNFGADWVVRDYRGGNVISTFGLSES